MPEEPAGSGLIGMLKDITAIISPIASFILAYIVFRFTRSVKVDDIRRTARGNFEDCLDKLLQLRQERAMLLVDRPNDLSTPPFADVNRAFNNQRNYYVNRAIEVLNRHNIELYPREKMLIADELFDEGRVALAIDYLNDAIRISDAMPMMKADALRSVGRRLHAMGQRTVGFEKILESIYVVKKLSESMPHLPERNYYIVAETYCLLADLKIGDKEYKSAADFILLAKETASIIPSGVNRLRMEGIIERTEKTLSKCVSEPIPKTSST